MSQRSATNKRTTERDVTGVARKSAASAKPAKAAGASVRVVATSGKAKREQMAKGEDLSSLTKEEKKARKKERRRQEDRVYAASDALMNEDPTYRRYHRIWWGIMIAGIAALVVLYLITSLFGESDLAWAAILQIALLVLAYGCIIVVFVFDFWKVRPIRREYQTIAEGMSEAKLEAVLAKAQAEDARKDAEKEARKAAKRAERAAKKNK